MVTKSNLLTLIDDSAKIALEANCSRRSSRKEARITIQRIHIPRLQEIARREDQDFEVDDSQPFSDFLTEYQALVNLSDYVMAAQLAERYIPVVNKSFQSRMNYD